MRAGGGNQHQLAFGEGRNRTDAPRQFGAGEARHHLVDHDEVVRGGAMPGALDLGQASEAVGRRGDDHAEAFEMMREDFDIHRHVVDDQRADAGELSREIPRIHDGDQRRTDERQLEPEGRAGAGLAVDADLAAHQLDELAADREAEPGAAELPRVTELSACVNFVNRRACTSSGMPMPVSVTSKRSSARPVPSRDERDVERRLCPAR